jgi:hypothetical protein
MDAFVIMLVAVFNFFLGSCVAYAISLRRQDKKEDLDEKEIYCNGFEDGIYYTIDEYNPELFKPEIAEMRYREYKAIKYGPERH